MSRESISSGVRGEFPGIDLLKDAGADTLAENDAIFIFANCCSVELSAVRPVAEQAELGVDDSSAGEDHQFERVFIPEALDGDLSVFVCFAAGDALRLVDWLRKV